MMDNDESKLKVNLEERIKAAMDRYCKSQTANNKKRPLLRRKNNFVLGSMGIFCEHNNVNHGSQIPIKGATNGK